VPTVFERKTTRSQVGRLLRFAPLAVVALAWLAIGLGGAYSYWENYYLHRGFGPVALLKHAARGRQLIVHFYSPALHRVADYLVYLPPHYAPRHHRYPVLYLLHGSPGRPQVFQAVAHMYDRVDNLLVLHRIRPMILVMPDGRINGSTFSDSEWANTPAGDFESYVINVVHNVDARFATLRGRRYRMIAGFSMGGFGAINIGLHNLPLFGSIEVWSGYFRETRSGVFAHATATELYDNSPSEYVPRMRRAFDRYPVRIFLYVGNRDRSGRYTVPMAAELRAAGADASAAVYPGGHDWQLWNGHEAQMLELASRWLHEPLPRPVLAAHARRRHRLAARARRHRLAAHRHRTRLRFTRRALAVPGGRRGPPGVRLVSAGARRRPPGARELRLVGGLALALCSATLINLGFLLQHRGLAAVEGRRRLAVLRNRSWLLGQTIGWVGFLAQIVAVALAPLSLVQAFAAGGLALSVPLATWRFGQRISGPQRLAVVTVAACLAALPIALPVVREHLRSGRLGAAAVALSLVGVAASLSGSGARRAIAAGLFYGLADAAIKAISVNLRLLGAGALLSVWSAVAALGTLAGFLAFQSALRAHDAVSSISLMTAFTTIVALGCGLLAFGESLGRGPGAIVWRAVAIGLVLACVPVLARAQLRLAAGGDTAAAARGF